MTALVNLFGVNTPTAPSNPLGGLLWGLFRGVNSALGLVPVAQPYTVGTPDPVTGTVTGTYAFTEPAGLDMTYAFTQAANGVQVYTDGTFTYTPTTAARQAATPGTTFSFNIIATDSVASTTQTITVPVLPLAVDIPVAGTASVGSPNPSTGAVIGNAMFTDPAGHTLTYSAPATSSGGGAVALNTTSGAFTYTPTPTQRQAATGTTTDTFTVTATNGTASTPETVTVPVLPLGSSGGGAAGPGIIPGVGGTNSHLTITPDGRFLYVLSGQNTVSVIDTSTNSVINPPISVRSGVDSYSQLIAANPNGSTVYVIDGTDTLSNPFGGAVSVINTIGNNVTGTVTGVQVSNYPFAVAFNSSGTRAYVVNARSGSVQVIDTSTNAVISNIDTGYSNQSDYVGSPNALAVAGSTVYLPLRNFGYAAPSDTVLAINTDATANNKTVVTLPTGYSGGVVASRDGAKVYVESEIEDSNYNYYDAVSVIDTSTNHVIGTYAITAPAAYAASVGGMAVSPDGSYLYLTMNPSSGGGSTMAVFRTADHTVVDNLSVRSGWAAGDLVISPDGSLAYIDTQISPGYDTAVQVIATNR